MPLVTRQADSGKITVSSSEPADPLTGDLWYDTGNTILKSYDGSSFVIQGTMILLSISATLGAENNELTVSGLTLPLSSYRELILIAELERGAGTGDLQLELNGLTSNYAGVETQQDGTPTYATESAQASSKIATSGYGTAGGELSKIIIHIFPPNTASAQDHIRFRAITMMMGSANESIYEGMNSTASQTQITGYRFFITTGTSKFTVISKAYLYGVSA